jgi:hypothetical protein
MNLGTLKTHLEGIGAVYGDQYVIDELGEGEVSGIAKNPDTGEWYTYYSERGERRGITIYPSEEKACDALREWVERILASEKSPG